MANLRSKYKPVKVSALKDKVSKENGMLGTTKFDDFLEIEDGKTSKFRIFPPHKGVDFYVMRKRHWLTIEGDDGPTKRTVLNSRQHGGTEKDIIEEYMKFCTSNLKDKSKLEKMTAYQGGLQAEHSWVCYATKITKEKTEFGLLAFKKTVRDALNKATFIEEDDEVMELDPFTDLDEGLPILIAYNANPNKKKKEEYYNVQISKKPTAISDEDLEKFDKSKPLADMFFDVYTLSEFELSLEGLRYFDTLNEIDFFEDDRWLEIVEEVKSQYDESDDDDEEEEDEKPKKKSAKSAPAKKSSKKVVEEEEDEDDDEEEDEEEEEKPAKKSVKKPLKKVVEEEEDDDDEEEDDDDDDDDDEEEEEEEKPKKKGAMTMQEIRDRLNKSKKK